MMLSSGERVSVERPVTRILAEIARILMPADRADGRLASTLELLREIVPYDQCALVEVSPEGENEVTVVPEPSALERSTIEQTLLRLLAVVGEPGAAGGVLGPSADVVVQEAWPSYLAVPLVGMDRVDGLLLVGQRVPDAYVEDDLRLLSIVASQIAAFLAACRLGVQKARLAEERIANLEALHERDERLRVGLAHAPIVVFQQDCELRYTWFDKLLPGFTAEAILGKSDQELFPSEVAEPLVAVKQQVMKTGRGAREEVRAPALDGKGLGYYDVSIEPLLDRYGEVVGITCAALDITQRKATEQLQRELIAMITHDLRTPLTTILGQADLLRHRGVYDERMVEGILHQADVLKRLVSDLEDFSRLEMGHADLRPEPVDLVTIVRETIVHAQAQTSLHELRLVGPSALQGEWDADRVFQILQNLLSNAIKYSPGGGEILVVVERRDDGAWVSIRDQGVGVASDILPRLFDRFYRAQDTVQVAPGLGLGLVIVRGLVEAHGGRIWVESEGADHGTTVTFTLPFERDTPRALQAPQLTRRQLEVAQLIAGGRSNAQIARELVLTTGTVANHIEHILRRLNVNNRAQVAAWVVEHGLLDRSGNR